MSIGVLFNTDRMAASDVVGFAHRAEALGIDSLWLPELYGREPFATAGWLLAATSTIHIGTAIANVYVRDAVATAAAASTLAEMSGDRFLLGLGVSNSTMNEMRGHVWQPPARKLRSYLEAMRAAPLTIPRRPVPVTVAAHGPRSIRAAGELADGLHTYLMTPAHTARTREQLPEGRTITPMLMALRADEPGEARRLARRAVTLYLGLPHYLEAWRADGFDESDVAEGGSDRLIDGLVAWGSLDRIRERIDEHRRAGADRVIIIPLNAAGGREPDWDLLTALAKL